MAFHIIPRLIGCALLITGSVCGAMPAAAADIADGYSTHGPLFDWFRRSAQHCLKIDDHARIASGKSSYPHHFNFGKTVSLTRFTKESPAEAYVLHVAELEEPASAYIVNFADYAGYTAIAYGILPAPDIAIKKLRYKLPTTTPGNIQIGDSADLVTERLGPAHRVNGCGAERWAYADPDSATRHGYGFFIKDGRVVLIYATDNE